MCIVLICLEGFWFHLYYVFHSVSLVGSDPYSVEVQPHLNLLTMFLITYCMFSMTRNDGIGYQIACYQARVAFLVVHWWFLLCSGGGMLTNMLHIISRTTNFSLLFLDYDLLISDCDFTFFNLQSITLTASYPSFVCDSPSSLLTHELPSFLFLWTQMPMNFFTTPSNVIFGQ